MKFFYGTMGSGKSTHALQIHYNLSSQGQRVLLLTQLDRSDGQVSSRLGVAARAEAVEGDTDLFELARMTTPLDAVVCDEAQFYEPSQVEQLARVVDELDVDVFAFGLLTTFQGEMFRGSTRFLELADVHVQLQVEARCFCGGRATHNARLIDGRQVYEGEVKVVGDTSNRSTNSVTYELRCRKHWHEARDIAETGQLVLGIDMSGLNVEEWNPFEDYYPVGRDTSGDRFEADETNVV